MDYYVLDGKEIVQTNDIKRFLANSRRVAETIFGDIRVSTVFLSLEHGYSDGKPILFETMIFGGVYDQEQWRYCTWDEAEKGHKIACERVWICSLVGRKEIEVVNERIPCNNNKKAIKI